VIIKISKLKKKLIFATIGIFCLGLAICYFTTPSAKSSWQDLNEQVSTFRDLKQGSFVDINTQALQAKEQVKEFQADYPEWRVEDVSLLSYSIDTISTVKYIQLGQDKLTHLLFHQASFQVQKDSMLLLMDSLKAGFYMHGNLGLGDPMVKEVQGKMGIVQFNIDWETKLNTLDSTISELVKKSWDLSPLATDKGLLRSASISNIAIIEKIPTEESNSPDQKRYVFRVKATAEGAVVPHFYSVSEDVYDLVFDGLIYCEGKANTDIVIGPVDRFQMQHKKKGTRRVL
jgi:hypothetical protein